MTKQAGLAVRVTCAAAVAAIASLGLASTSAEVGATAYVPTSARGTVGWVTGHVVDQQGDPVAGALVNTLDARQVPEAGLPDDITDRRATTDTSGRFRVRQAPGGFLVQICRPEPDVPTACKETVRGVDFVITYVGGTGVTDSWVTQRSLIPATAGDLDLNSVAVKPEARVHGVLVGGQRQQVSIMRLNDTVAFSVVADAQGRYAFDGLVPGRYYLAAGGDGTLPWRSPDLVLGADEDRVVDGRLEVGSRISGRVRSDGRPVVGLDLILRSSGTPVAAAATDEHGRYAVSGLRPGHYRVTTLDGGTYLPARKLVTLGAEAQATADLTLTEGATISLRLVGERQPGAARDELRDVTGRPVELFRNDGEGLVTYTGLRRGRYSVVVGGEHGYTTRTVAVRDLRDYRLGDVRARTRYLTVSGTTTPRGVVEATTGDFCPADGATRYGAIHEIAVADGRGRYVLRRLVPGRYMTGADGWPRNVVPTCESGVKIAEDTHLDTRLRSGARVTGRLVYADSGTPLITTLSYELRFSPGSRHNPTAEHPARDRTTGASGAFVIAALRQGRAMGFLATEAGEQINDPSYQVVFPFQDGTPYWLEAPRLTLDIGNGATVDLGAIEIQQH